MGTLTNHLMISDDVFFSKIWKVTFLKLERLILNRFSGKPEFIEWLISACVPIDRTLVSSHQELLTKISTLLSNNETGNRCKVIKKGENPEQNIPIPKGFLSIFLANMLLERYVVYTQRPIFLLFYFNIHKKNP